jgi:poly(A) polymerase
MRTHGNAPIPTNLAGADWLARGETQAVFTVLQAGGYAIRAVGGCVRNTLLGKPAGDIDFATTARPGDVVRLASAAGHQAIPTGIAHGTVTVIINGTPFEITTLRRDVSTDGRRATVAFTDDWAEDAGRRDFTLNALYCDADGRLHDPLGGLEDLLARRIRFIGEPADRIREDYLRILRFFRLHAEHANGPLDPSGLAASIALRDGLASLSGERVQKELLRLAAAPGAAAALRAMGEAGMFTTLFGITPRPNTLDAMIDIEASLAIEADPVRRIAALLVETSADAARIDERLKLSRSDRAALDLSVTATEQINPSQGEPALRRALYRSGSAVTYKETVIAAWARSGSAAGQQAWRHAFNLPDRWPRPDFPLRGTDVLALGIAPGPAVGELLAQVEAWWIESDFLNDRRVLLDKLAATGKRG